MKNEIGPKIADPTEALLHDLIAECHAIIRDDILPTARKVDDNERASCLYAVNDLMKSAVRLADAVGRLRSPAPPPELRQRITVERVQRLPAPGGRGVGENG